MPIRDSFMNLRNFFLFSGSLTALLSVSSCYPTPGPDKAVAGAVLGAGWGAGAGAVIGNQVNDPGPGAAIGAGFGAVSGLVSGIGFDVAEGEELAQQRELDALKVQVAANQRALLALQDNLDDRTQQINAMGFSDQVFFDANRASLRLGSAAKLQRLAEAIKQNPYVTSIELHGHADDMGDTEKNKSLSEARARTVATFLVNQGISLDRIHIIPHGAENPLASNETEAGRQLNRRVEIVLRP
jgi:outer membrane protein OmpA-like peptidoglycan-associated protein